MELPEDFGRPCTFRKESLSAFPASQGSGSRRFLFLWSKRFTRIPKPTPSTKRRTSFLIAAGLVFPNERKCEIKTESIAMAEIHLRHCKGK